MGVSYKSSFSRRWKREKCYFGKIANERQKHMRLMGTLTFSKELSWRYVLLRWGSGMGDRKLREDDSFSEMYEWLDSRKDIWERMDAKFPVDYQGQWEGTLADEVLPRAIKESVVPDLVPELAPGPEGVEEEVIDVVDESSSVPLELPPEGDLNWASDVVWVYEHFKEEKPAAPSKGARGLWAFAHMEEKEFQSRMVPKAVEIIAKRKEQERLEALEAKDEVKDDLRSLEQMVADL